MTPDRQAIASELRQVMKSIERILAMIEAPGDQEPATSTPDDDEEEREYQDLMQEIQENGMRIRFDHYLGEDDTGKLLWYASNALGKKRGAVIEHAFKRGNQHFYHPRDIAKTRLQMKRGKKGKLGIASARSDA